jgi:phage replication-related protein YjqB (UPF0714/DUF867 family)
VSFADLLAHPGVEEDLVLRGGVGFMAPHGGNLEEQTDVVAAAAAEAAGASLYSVRQPSDLRWHIPSTALTPDVSPSLRAFLDHVDSAIAVHGYGRPSLRGVILVGGRDRALAAALAANLRFEVPEHPVLDDLDAIPRELRGQHRRNVVNLVGPAGGVQLELPPSARSPVPDGLVRALARTATDWAAQGARRSIDQPDGESPARR